VVGSRSHGAEAIVASGETAINSGGQESLAVTSVVDTLEEDELLGIEGLGRVGFTAEILDRDVSVSDDLATTIDVLRSRVVGIVRIGEGARCQVCRLDVHVEALVLGKVVAVLRRLEVNTI